MEPKTPISEYYTWIIAVYCLYGFSIINVKIKNDLTDESIITITSYIFAIMYIIIIISRSVSFTPGCSPGFCCRSRT
jgi:hypothetical protein